MTHDVSIVWPRLAMAVLCGAIAAACQDNPNAPSDLITPRTY